MRRETNEWWPNKSVFSLSKNEGWLAIFWNMKYDPVFNVVRLSIFIDCVL